MVLSPQNLKVLKSIAQVNSQIYFVSEDLGVSSNNKIMLCYYPWGVKLEQEFGIYDVNELLSIISIYSNPTIIEREVPNKESDVLTITEGSQKSKYKYTPKTMITTPPPRSVLFDGPNKKIPAPSSTFTLSKDELNKIKSQASVLKSPNIKFEKDKIVCFDSSDSSCNTFEHIIKPSKDISKIVIGSEYLQKLYDDEYTVGITDKLTIWKSQNEGLIYIIVSEAE